MVGDVYGVTARILEKSAMMVGLSATHLRYVLSVRRAFWQNQREPSMAKPNIVSVHVDRLHHEARRRLGWTVIVWQAHIM